MCRETPVFLAVLACLTAQTPQQQQQQQQDLTIQMNVNLIQIDVTVFDKNRQHVPGLTAEDFEVFRDGKRQPITKALYVSTRPLARSEKAPTPDAPGVSPILPAGAAKQPQAKDIRRTIAIYIDDLSINFENVVFMRDALRKFVHEQVVEGDVVAVYRSSGGLGLFQQFTSDKRAILAGIDQIRYRNINGTDSLAPISANAAEEDPDATIAQMALQQRLSEEVFLRNRQDLLTAGMLSTAGFIVRGLREMPGRKSMVIFSESIQLNDAPQTLYNPTADPMRPGAMGGPRDRTLKAIQGLVDLANRSGVTFYTVDPRGLQFLGLTAADTPSTNPRAAQARMQQRQSEFLGSQDGMSLLADETGGLFFGNTNDLGRAMAEAANDQDGYYLIAFRPDDETFEKNRPGEPKTHRLTIKVKKPGLKVRYRKSFAGVPDSERVPKSSNPLVTAMSSPFRSVEIGVKLTPLYLEDPKGGGPFIRAMLFLDPKGLHFTEEPASPEDKNQAPWNKAVARQLLVLYDQTGRAVDQAANAQTIKIRKPSFEQALRNGISQIMDIPVKTPGPYQLRAAIMDDATKQTGSSAQFIFVPDLKNKQLAMSDMSISSEAASKAESPEGAPELRILRGGDNLTYGAYIYNARPGKQPGKANLETQVILYREGKVVYTGKKSPYQPTGLTEGAPLTIAGKLTLGAGIAPGDYVLQVAIRDLEAPKKHQFALRTADFAIRAPESAR